VIGDEPCNTEMIRTLQRKLYRKAKAEPAFRFYLLYDKICGKDILAHAYALARANAGAPGVDGVSFPTIETSGGEAWLTGLREELVAKTYRPQPVRRVMIPKPGGGERPLGIPTIRDRVVQTAAKLVLEPIFEADLEDNAYCYRPARGAVDAIKEVHRLICRGHTDVVDADLAKRLHRCGFGLSIAGMTDEGRSRWQGESGRENFRRVASPQECRRDQRPFSAGGSRVTISAPASERKSSFALKPMSSWCSTLAAISVL
jgi:retron-type reverse transcriptase